MTEFTPMPASVAEAINKVAASLDTLAKDERNKFAGYDFVGIDTFLRVVGGQCAAHGLIIVQDEKEYEIVEGRDEKDKVTSWLRIAYQFTLAHKDGSTWEHRPTRFAMANAKMGAQAFGAAQSYALKQFMRSLFMVATGEKEDSDSHEQSRLPDQPRKGEMPKRTTEQQYFVEISTAIKQCQSADELNKVWGENESNGRLSAIKKTSEEGHQKLLALFSKRLAELPDESTTPFDGEPA